MAERTMRMTVWLTVALAASALTAPAWAADPNGVPAAMPPANARVAGGVFMQPMKGLGPFLPPAGVFQPPPEGQGLATITVASAGYRWANVKEVFGDDPNYPVAKGQFPFYSLSLAGKFAGPVHQIDGGNVEKVIADSGEDLLGPNPVSFNPNLVRGLVDGKFPDGQVFLGNFRMGVPGAKATKIKELSGKLYYTVLLKDGGEGKYEVPFKLENVPLFGRPAMPAVATKVAEVASGAPAAVAPLMKGKQWKGGYVAIETGPGEYQPAPKERGLEALTVVGVSFKWFDLKDWGDDRVGYTEPAFYGVTIAGKFAGPVLRVKGLNVEKAVTNTGEDLLGGNLIGCYPMMLDGRVPDGREHENKVFEGNFRTALPDEKATTLKELSGQIYYTVLGQGKAVDLGLAEFKAGAAGTAFGAEVERMNDPQGHEGKMLTLKLQARPEQFVQFSRFKFFDADGKELAVQREGDEYGQNNTMRVYTFSRAEGFPAKGRIEVVVLGEEKYMAPFKLENVPLYGRPAKPAA